MYKIVGFLIALNLAGCALIEDYQSPEYVLIAEDILASSGAKLAARHNMYLFGNSGRMMTCIKSMGVSFQVFRPLTRDEARELVIQCALEFLDDINNDSRIRPYLVNYPFTPTNIEIEIFTQNEDGIGPFDPYISVAALEREGKVTFATESPLDKFKYENFYVETFDEALAKVQGSQS